VYPESYELTIRGNQEDPKYGNPIPYCRMTQRSKFKSKTAKRYLAWKEYVQECWLEAFGKGSNFPSGGCYRLNVDCYFRSENHGDPENVRKGIQDALFADDKHVWGTVRFYHGRIPGVTIWVDEDLHSHVQDITSVEARHRPPTQALRE